MSEYSFDGAPVAKGISSHESSPALAGDEHSLPEPAGAAPPKNLETLESAFGDEAGTVDIFLGFDERPTAAALSSRTARALLLRMDGLEAGAVFALDPLPCTIGRHPANTIRVDDDSVSRFHVRVSRDNQGFLLEDLQSRNGTFVGRKRIAQDRLQDGDEVTLGSRVAFRFNITDTLQERVLRRMYESSTRDALTGAYNRAQFDRRLREELSHATRHGVDLSLAMLDIDHFKRINDTYGHQAGDMVLKEIVAASQSSLRIEDVFARFGGEEFVVILRGTCLNGAKRLGERLRVAIEQAHFEFDGQLIPVTLSAGCASTLCCTDAVTPTELVRIADRRLYLAKTRGRNRVVADG